MGKSTISMAIFNSYVKKLPEGKPSINGGTTWKPPYGGFHSHGGSPSSLDGKKIMIPKMDDLVLPICCWLLGLPY